MQRQRVRHALVAPLAQQPPLRLVGDVHAALQQRRRLVLGPLQVHDDVRRGVEARLQVDGRLLGRGELALVDAHAAHRVRRAAALAALWAHGLGDRRRCAPVVLLTLPAALVARLPIARVRGGCISCSFRSHPSGCRSHNARRAELGLQWAWDVLRALGL